MRKSILIAVLMLALGFVLVGGAGAQQTPAATAPTGASTADAASPADKELPTQKDKSSYAIGMNIAGTIKKQQLDLDTATLLRGIQDTLAGKPLLTDEQAQAAIATLVDAAQQKLGETNM